jgi:hypothetical protein
MAYVKVPPRNPVAKNDMHILAMKTPFEMAIVDP